MKNRAYRNYCFCMWGLAGRLPDWNGPNTASSRTAFLLSALFWALSFVGVVASCFLAAAALRMPGSGTLEDGLLFLVRLLLVAIIALFAYLWGVIAARYSMLLARQFRQWLRGIGA